MEFIFELLYELILEISAGITMSKDAPSGFRIGAGIILFIIYGGLLALFLYAALDAWGKANIRLAVICILLSVALITLVTYVIIKNKKDKK